MNTELSAQMSAAYQNDLADSVGFGIAAVDASGRQTYVNAAFANMVGWTTVELVGMRAPYPYWPAEEHASIQSAFAQTLAGKAPEEGFELRFCHKNGTRFDVLVLVTALPNGAGYVASVTKLTSYLRGRRAHSLLLEASRVLGSSLDYQTTLRTLAHITVPAIADYCLIDLLEDDGAVRRVEIAHRDQRRVPDLWAMYERWPADLSDATGIGAVLRTGRPVLASVITDEMLTAHTSDPDKLRQLRAMELRSCIIVPMVARDRTLGAITLNSSSSERVFTEHDLELAAALAERAAIAIDNARLHSNLQREMRDRRDLQADLHMATSAGGLGYWTYTPATGQVTWDDKYREIFGLPSGVAPTFEAGMSVVHPDDFERVQSSIARAARDMSEFRSELRIIRDGHIRWVLSRGRAVPNADGALHRLAGFVLDITDRIESEERWRKASQHLELALSHSGLGDWRWEAATDLVYFSQRAAEIFEIAVDPPMTWTQMQTLLHPEDADRAAKAVVHALEARTEYAIEYRVRSRDLGYRWVEAHARGVYNDSGVALSMVGTLQDVTERRRAEEAARVLAAAGPALTALDPDNILKELVRLAADHLGDYALAYHVREDGSIRPAATAHKNNDLAELVAEVARIATPRPDSSHMVARAAATGQPVGIARASRDVIEAAALNPRHLELLRALRPSGAIAVPLIARGRTVAVYAVARAEGGREDFTQADFDVIIELASRAALAFDNAQLYQAAHLEDAAKGQFIATISHELRTPLNAIIGYTDLLDAGVAGRLTETQTDFIRRIRTSAGHQAALVEDILDFSRLEAGQQVVDMAPVHLGKLLADVRDVMLPVATAKMLELTVDSSAADLVVNSDAARLRQIVINLVGNAVKFTDAGRISVQTAVRNGRLNIAVSDTGPGIPAAQHAAIFQPFYQVDQSRTRKNGGAGLGLSIAMRLVRSLRGDITVTSEPGNGSTFTVTLPLSDG
jgi:PAS domain S-box-containing protein